MVVIITPCTTLVFVSIVLCTFVNSYRYKFIRKVNNAKNSETWTMKDAKNKNIVAFIKGKRLLQIVSSTGNYTDYLREQEKYEPRDNNGSLVATDVSRMKSVLQYVQNKRISENRIVKPGNKLVAFLLDTNVNVQNRNHHDKLSNISEWQVLDMPNIHDFNTKRYESLWIQYMKSLDLSQYCVVIGHGSSAEALMRYLESHSLPETRIVVIDPTDLYTAGERHGRQFRFYYIVANSLGVDVYISPTSPIKSESLKVYSDLVDQSNDERVKLFEPLDDHEYNILLQKKYMCLEIDK